ncbi:MAG: hypothetical protein AAF443_06340 [Chlamydiota bacterium]
MSRKHGILKMSEQLSEQQVKPKRHHPWRVRALVALAMLVFSFVGLVISDLKREGAWNYWRVMVPVFAVFCLFLSWYLRHHKHVISATTIWHELAQWLGLILAVYLVSVFVGIGLIGRFQAGLIVLVLLALTTFITGIYIESTFLAIGIVLGLFAAGAALLAAYLYTVMLPITIVVAALLFWIAKRHH